MADEVTVTVEPTDETPDVVVVNNDPAPVEDSSDDLAIGVALGTLSTTVTNLASTVEAIASRLEVIESRVNDAQETANAAVEVAIDAAVEAEEAVEEAEVDSEPHHEPPPIEPQREHPLWRNPVKVSNRDS
jgi:hypothetical protein